jgi:hypothetical protein
MIQNCYNLLLCVSSQSEFLCSVKLFLVIKPENSSTYIFLEVVLVRNQLPQGTWISINLFAILVDILA